jgi:hypothetical protein
VTVQVELFKTVFELSWLFDREPSSDECSITADGKVYRLILPQLTKLIKAWYSKKFTLADDD